MYGIKAIQQLESISLGSMHEDLMLGDCVRNIRDLTDRISGIDMHLEKAASQNDDAKLLLGMTGMGPYTALLLAVEIGDISRFATPKKMVSWAGLCPTVYRQETGTTRAG